MNIGKNPNGLNQISSSLISLYVSGSESINFTPSSTYITGSLKVTGSIEINNTNIQYYNPQSVLFLPPVYTLITSASTTYNVYVTQSGPYFIDCTNIPNNTSCSVNFYVYPDLMPSGFVANINSLAPISTGSNLAYINYRTIVSASNSTSYYQQSSTTQGTNTVSVSKGFRSRIAWIPLGNENNSNMGWFFKTPANQVMLLAKPSQLEGNLQIGSVSYYLFTGSQGTPIP